MHETMTYEHGPKLCTAQQVEYTLRACNRDIRARSQQFVISPALTFILLLFCMDGKTQKLEMSQKKMSSSAREKNESIVNGSHSIVEQNDH